MSRKMSCSLGFLIFLSSCTLKFDVSKEDAYKAYVNNCFITKRDLIVYKTTNREVYLRYLVDDSKVRMPDETGSISYEYIPESMKSDWSLISKGYQEKVVAIVPKGTCIKIEKIFYVHVVMCCHMIYTQGRINLPTIKNQKIDFRELFSLPNGEYGPDPRYLEPINCSEGFNKL